MQPAPKQAMSGLKPSIHQMTWREHFKLQLAGSIKQAAV
jgi:hypothetical protein